MKKRTSRKQILQHCEEIGSEDGVDPRDLIRRATNPQTDRKALQLCRQVERTISLVLSGDLNDDRVRDLMVVSVVPAPHSNHLLATVQTCEVVSQDDLLALDAVLAGYRGQIRCAIADAIHRKKTPDITLRVICPS